MNLKMHEKELVGHYIINNLKIEADEVAKRIVDLISNYLIFIKADESGWFKLYQDPFDKRYWELSYPSSEEHGGGAPKLTNVSKKEAETKYNL